MSEHSPQQVLQEALAAHSSGDLARAEATYQQILSLDPRHAVAWNLLGIVAHQTGRHDQALQHVGRALQLKPADPDFHANYGRVLAANGETARADDSFKKSLAL